MIAFAPNFIPTLFFQPCDYFLAIHAHVLFVVDGQIIHTYTHRSQENNTHLYTLFKYGLAGAFALKPTVCVNAVASPDFSPTFPVITAQLNRSRTLFAFSRVLTGYGPIF